MYVHAYSFPIQPTTYAFKLEHPDPPKSPHRMQTKFPSPDIYPNTKAHPKSNADIETSNKQH